MPGLCKFSVGHIADYHIIILCVLLVADDFHVQAQTARFFAGDEYLGNSVINDLLQDREGCLWVATQGGLTRYDSHQFKTYRQSTDGLIGNHVLRLTEDALQQIVVGTTVGVQLFSPSILRFTNILFFAGEEERTNLYVNALLKRRNGDVLIATSGFGIFVLKPGSTEAHYSEHLMFAELVDVKDMVEDEDGTLWMAAANDGVLKIEQGSISVYLNGDHTMTGICISRSGMVYASGMAGGIFRYDTEKDTFVRIEGTSRMAINRMTERADSSILIATDGHGLMHLTASGSLSPSELYAADVDQSKVSIAIEDRDGNIWIGLWFKGLLMQSRYKNDFGYIGDRSITQNLIGNHCVSAVFRDKNGTVWVGTDGDGLYSLSPNPSYREKEVYVSNHFPITEKEIRGEMVPANILSICEDHQGHLYLASWLGGCGRFDRTTGRYEQLSCTKTGNAIHVMSMVVDNNDNLWMATNGDGLKCLNLPTNRLTEYRSLNAAAQEDKENVLSNDWVSGLSISPDGNRLYLAMSSGVGCFDLQSHSFLKTFGKNFLLEDHAVNAVLEDVNGQVWVATFEGLFVVTPHNGDIRRLTIANGLPANEIVSLEIAPDGQLWVGTLHGLCRIDINKYTCTNFFKIDGLQGNEFYKGASDCFTDGRLAFGGTGGLTLFYPRDIQTPQTDVRVRLAGMTVSGQEVSTLTRSGWYQVCDTTVCDATRFDLAYGDNSFTLSFSTMDYIRADGLHYEYRTVTDSMWQRLPMGVNVLTMSHLAPGTYQMRVRAVSGSSVSEELAFVVVVHPAWYASTFAKILYCLFVLLLIWQYMRRLRSAEQQRLRVQEHIHAAQMRQIEDDALNEDKQRERLKQVVEDLIEKPSLQTPDERLMNRVMQVVNSHIADSELSVEQIAVEVGLSRSHLHRKMKELTGESTSDFVRNVRLKRAAYLLEGGRHSIAEVMYACGFETPSGFSTCFKNFYGVSPSDYMREHSYSGVK